jgi:MFS family permease
MNARASAVAVVFVANGLGGPSFLPRLPERQSELGLSDAGLGIVLAGMAAGALAASPVAGRLVGAVGSRAVVVGAALALAASLPTAGSANRPVLLFLALTVIGAADAAMDIAMNANGATYERLSGRSVMHRLHGAWSLGALAAAGVAATAAGRGVSLTLQLAVLGAVIALGVAVARPWLATGDLRATSSTEASAPGTGSPATSAPGRSGFGVRYPLHGRSGRAVAYRLGLMGPLVVLGAATVAGALIEGAPADWSAIRLERLGTGPGVAALGFAAFMAGMLGGRLAGDQLTDRFGGAAVLRGGMALVAAGMIVGALVDHPAAFAVGLVLAGLGASSFFPLAFSAAGRTPGVAPGAGAATVSLAARLGFLVEPLAMGALAELIGLRWAFVVVAGAAAVVAIAAPRLIPPASRLGAAPVTDVRAV